ncbi:MAG: FAD-dependent oxidoreductase [Bacillota bacterium]
MTKKQAVYFCSGCGIGEALDLAALTKVANKEFKIQDVREHPFLCSPEGVALIKQDIEAGFNTLTIAACSDRVCYDVFNFGPAVIVERVPLRERVAWVQEPGDEDTNMMAEDYMRMGLSRVKATELPEPFMVENPSRTILVVGSGLAGLTAAWEAANAGYEVVLVEKSAKLGGWAGQAYKLPPTKEPYTDLEENPIPALAKAVEDHPKIKVYKEATMEQISGGPGVFDAKIKQGGTVVDERIGAVVLAAGSRPYDPKKLDYLGFGKPNVVTQSDVEALANSGELKNVKRVAFIQCAGSRDANHLPYCSAACCVETLKQAVYLKEFNPEAQAYIFYKDIRATGKYEYFYKAVQQTGAVFIKTEIPGVEVSEDGGKLAVTGKDLILGEDVKIGDLDLVVLANGMQSNAAFGEEIAVEAEQEAAAAKEEEAVKPDQIIKSGLLNLAYRQGPEMPALKYGFPDSHFICFPYETRRTGIYAAGTVRATMQIPTAIEDGTGAALKAIQCVEAVIRGEAVHPRAGDTSYPEFFMQRCTQCKRCTEECPFGAINEDEKANPLPERTRCRRCGTCMGACPERIISFKDYSVPMIGGMGKAIEVPEEDEEKPRILIFACENDAIPALDMAGISRMKFAAWVRVIPLRCLGSLNLVWVSDAMSGGFDGVMLLGCKHGEDYQCHFVKGSELAEIRLSKVSETLDRLGLESERCRMHQISIMDYFRIPQLIGDFVEKIDQLGPNPMKGF